MDANPTGRMSVPPLRLVLLLTALTALLAALVPATTTSPAAAFPTESECHTETGGTGGAGFTDHAQLHRELDRIGGTATGRWDQLAAVSIPRALPAAVPPTPRGLRRPVDLGDGLFVAGDHRDTPSVQGALVSGRRTGQAVLAHLGR